MEAANPVIRKIRIGAELSVTAIALVFPLIAIALAVITTNIPVWETLVFGGISTLIWWACCWIGFWTIIAD
jgi:hypothetical protein